MKLRPSLICTIVLCFSATCHADIFRWDNGELIPGTEEMEPAPGVDWSRQQLEFGLRIAYLARADLSNSNLSGIDLSRANLTSAKLTSADLSRAHLSSAHLTSADLRRANLSHADLIRANLSHADLNGADLTGANLRSSNLTSAELSGANLTSAELTSADVSTANLSASGVTSDQFYSTDTYRRDDMEAIDLSFLDLAGWDFSNKNLSYANLESSNLSSVNLSGANLVGANFSSANLAELNLSEEATYSSGTLFPDDFVPPTQQFKLVESTLGDLSFDNRLDGDDMRLLNSKLSGGLAWHDDAIFDMNGDSALDESDAEHWIREIMRPYIGDSNLDGEFNSRDFVTAFSQGRYETGEFADWTAGDWDFDGDFDSSDFVAAFADGGYEQGPKVLTENAQVNAVPEPSSAVLLFIGLLALGRRRK